MTDKELLQQALRALVVAEAGLADIGDADREPGDDLAWCEARAAQALELPRAAIIALRAAIAQPEQPTNDALTSSQIAGLIDDVIDTDDASLILFARAVEAAHGIGEPP